ncbi:MAG: hypothetical protein WBA97_32185 [Actinophytocola sp.]|uniref:hypothetical protein n=1 Tax=Actinophytocola sp. TaxID=1872138 RepID=UPI003C727BB4
MEGRLFTLVSADDDDNVFAWGLEITTPNDQEAVTYCRNLSTNQAVFGLHPNAESALRRYGSTFQLRLVWDG